MNHIFYKIHSISFGDTLASTPTLRYLSKSHESKINVVTHNKQVFNQNPYIENLLSFEEYEELKNYNDLIYQSFTYAGTSDKNGIEKKFSHIDTRQLHSMDLGFQLDPEDMSYDYYPSQFNLDIVLPEKYVVLHITSNWPNRTWSIENWQKLINWLSENKIFTVLIGFGYKESLHNSLSDKPLEKVCPHFENLYGLDLTNQGSVSDMWWVINGSKCIVTMDSGPLHIAGCTDTTILQLGSAINPKFRAPFRHGSQDYKYHYLGGSCNIFCNSNLFYNVQHWGDINHIPPQPDCLENKPTFEELIQNLEEIRTKLKALDWDFELNF
jgi:ADP-heptose:LPS heptosyltransferase